MFEPGWNRSDSPFHKGEQLLQERYGVREQLESFGRRVIRDYMPVQHQEFYGQLPLLNVATRDSQGRAWASVVVGEPGFMHANDGKVLKVGAKPLPGDPLNENLKTGQYIGVLGLELHSRRRNRMSGKIGEVSENGFDIEVIQSFGNCPQYIQSRMFSMNEERAKVETPEVIKSSTFTDKMTAIVENADTFFIASLYGDNDSDLSHGADASHRGGQPGFVKVENGNSLVWPDFIGNFHFNTLGNLILNPSAGLLFIDFDHGHLLHVTGKAEIIWGGPEVQNFMGAERIVKFALDEAVLVESVLPLDYQFGDYSPVLRRTGTWK